MNKYAKQAKEAKLKRIKKRSCEDKARFKTKDDAYQKGQEVYKCKFCGGWHRSGALAKTLALSKGRKMRKFSL